MSIERIKEKILENAKEDARRIYDKGKMESRALIYEARRIGEGEIRESKTKASEDAVRVKSRRESIANLEARKMQLAAKQEVIGACFEEASRRILALPKEEYVQFLAGKVEEIGAEQGVIALNERDREAIGAELIEAVNRKGGAFTLSENTIDAAGGFMLTMGRIEIDSTLEMMMSSIKEDVMPDVVAALFG